MKSVSLLGAAVLTLVLAASACSSSDEEGDEERPVEIATTASPAAESTYEVARTDDISGPDIANMTAWAPVADGEWPVVLLLAGWSGVGDHYTVTAEALAGEGVVVFAPDYRAQAIDGPNWQDTYRDAECAYRHARNVAADFGGDLGRPVTVAGHSTGAVVGVSLTLAEEQFGPQGPFDRCPAQDVPRPDRVVGLAGCYLESGIDDSKFPWDPSTFGWTNYDAEVHLVVGADDAVCEAWQSEQAAELLREDGFESVELTTLDDADHFDVMFARWEGNGEWFDPATEWFDEPEDPAGVASAEAILETVQAP